MIVWIEKKRRLNVVVCEFESDGFLFLVFGLSHRLLSPSLLFFFFDNVAVKVYNNATVLRVFRQREQPIRCFRKKKPDFAARDAAVTWLRLYRCLYSLGRRRRRRRRPLDGCATGAAVVARSRVWDGVPLVRNGRCRLSGGAAAGGGATITVPARVVRETGLSWRAKLNASPSTSVWNTTTSSVATSMTTRRARGVLRATGSEGGYTLVVAPTTGRHRPVAMTTSSCSSKVYFTTSRNL